VAIANPATAPYGRAAEAAMRAVGVYEAVKPKLALGENVAQALQFVESGSADVGVVALSLAIAPTVKGRGRYSTVPVELYPRMEQGGVILRSAGDPDAARAVRAFLIGDEGRSILKRYGFFPPGT
jgi:molybdate transport system substrate-binding protein